MRILVTGASGFIGRHVAQAAHARGHVVRLLSSGLSGQVDLPGGERIERVVHDLRKPEGLSPVLDGVDAVVHCASLLSGSEAEQQAVTVGGTEHLLNAMDAARVRQIVLVSTCAIYDYRALRTGSALTEDSPLDDRFVDRAPYIRAKRTQEDLVRARGRERGWRVTTLRPGLVYGQDRMWFHHLGMQWSRLWVTLAGRSRLPLTFVENCAEAIVLALDVTSPDAVVNVIDDHTPERRAYVRELSRSIRPRPVILDVPWEVVCSGAALAGAVNRLVLRGKAPLPDLLRPASLAARSKPLTYPNDHAKRVLGWAPRVSLAAAFSRRPD
jgi:nucleoside-diphosphate-sugar epimerase